MQNKPHFFFWKQGFPKGGGGPTLGKNSQKIPFFFLGASLGGVCQMLSTATFLKKRQCDDKITSMLLQLTVGWMDQRMEGVLYIHIQDIIIHMRFEEQKDVFLCNAQHYYLIQFCPSTAKNHCLTSKVTSWNTRYLVLQLYGR